MQPEISRGLIVLKRQEPERPQAVLHRDEDHAPPGRPVEEGAGPVDGAVVVPDGEGAPVEPHDDGNRVVIVVAAQELRREDVEVEAVLLAEDEEVLLGEDDVALDAGSALAAAAVLHPVPTLGLLRQGKSGIIKRIMNWDEYCQSHDISLPQFSDGWPRVGYLAEREVGDSRHFRLAATSPHFSLGSFHNR